MKTRDSQRSKLYAAERVLRPSDDPEFTDIEQIQRYVARLVTSDWFRHEFGRHIAVPRIEKGRGSNADGLGRRIRIATWGFTKMVVLHELAHCIISRGYWEHGGPWHHEKHKPAAHGREFAAVMLKLVQHEMGVEEARILRQSYVQKGVKYRAKKTLSPATLERLRERGRQLQEQRRQSA